MKCRRHLTICSSIPMNQITAGFGAFFLTHSQANKELRAQEPLIQSYIELLISKLKEQVDGSSQGTVNISNWLNFVTFDIIGDLASGEPFGCLETGLIHPWVKIMFSSIRDIIYIAALSHLPPPIFKAIMSGISCFMMKDLQADTDFAVERVASRLKKGTTRNDFMSPIIRANDEHGMSIGEIEASFNILIVAGNFLIQVNPNLKRSLTGNMQGSETSATLLCGALYNLALHPQILQTLLSELRTKFSSRSQVNMAALQDLPYLNAVLEECLRIYPPSAFNQARVVPPNGSIICGKFVPGGTAVGVASLGASLSSSNWSDAGTFKPERWLGKPLDGDDRRSMQPFILGPRNCLGKNVRRDEIDIVSDPLRVRIHALRGESLVDEGPTILFVVGKATIDDEVEKSRRQHNSG
ncbi:Cytochrome P450 monooxygenase aclL [Lachnellula suecica]|uniref:Cytochrome P450 monooxygenase aclL n=1 Tax=Lachnellula suecica TaxID=602035 RepID=A0A8T9CDX3_9HELO|nr:Cytochrome P450 monooxygenase aclL [Lachnellula suecica]